MNYRWFLLMVVAVAAALSIGCSTTTKEDDVSSIPWNRPQQWEGQGALGGMRPQGQGY
jgi:hypothetical protein